MNRILSADLTRLWKSRTFWFSGIFMALYAGFVCLFMLDLRETLMFDSVFLYGFGMDGLIAVPGIAMAVLCSLFIGTEYSDGTIRNKLIVGRTRNEIFLSNFLTCAAAGIALNLIYSFFVCLFGIPLYGGIQMDPKTLFTYVIAGLMMMISYAAILNTVTMLIANKTTASVASFLTVFIVMCIASYTAMRLHQPELTDLYELSEKSGEWVSHIGPNPYYIGGAARQLCQFFINLLPTGQAIQLSNQSAPSVWPLPLYSLAVILAANGFGILLFRKKDLK